MCVGGGGEGRQLDRAHFLSLSLSLSLLGSFLGSTSQLVLRLAPYYFRLHSFFSLLPHLLCNFFRPRPSCACTLCVFVCDLALVCVYSRRLCTQFRYTLIPPINFDNFIISLFIHFFLFSLLFFRAPNDAISAINIKLNAMLNVNVYNNYSPICFAYINK